MMLTCGSCKLCANLYWLGGEVYDCTWNMSYFVKSFCNVVLLQEDDLDFVQWSDVDAISVVVGRDEVLYAKSISLQVRSSYY